MVQPQAVAQLEQRARALENENRLRRRLEQRMRQLFALSGDLAAARTREDAARLTIAQGAQAVGASTASLWLLGASRTHLEMFAASDGSSGAPIDLAGESPLAHAVRTGETVFVGSRAEHDARFPTSSFAAEDSATAFAILPVAAEAGPIGALFFSYDHDRSFEDPDRAFKWLLARQCAVALERIALQDHERALREAAETAAAAEKQARADSELLYELTASINRLDDIGEVNALALQAVRHGSRSDRAAILMFDDAGVMRFLASDGLSDTYRAAVEGHTPWRQDEAAPMPIIVEDTETDPAFATYREVFRAEGIRALAFVPIAYHRKLLGKFMLYRNEPRPFLARELLLTATVAVHLAHAVARAHAECELARAYREEREAHFLAEQATRAREEILSVVSHDLRNPLGAIMMGAATLLGPGDRGAHRARSIAERIHRQAERMARLIEDLVDFAGIEAGQFAMQRATHQPEKIIAAASDIFGPLAEERGLRFETSVQPGLPPIQCDSDRAVQVLSNLVSNALKVTPRGGAVAIGARPNDREVVFYVRDTGPGIEADDLPNLFERYWRSKNPQYKGSGLGLSIARGIVDAHGGRIWAESQLGVGSTFFFSLSPTS